MKQVKTKIINLWVEKGDPSESTRRNIAHYIDYPQKITARLRELENEWDLERVLETSAASLLIGSFFLGSRVSRKFYSIAPVIAGFLLQHSLMGSCPPASLLRSLGFRTEREINEERLALKALRGDFLKSHEEHLSPHGLLEAARA